MIRKVRPMVLLVEPDPTCLLPLRKTVSTCAVDLFVAESSSMALELARQFDIKLLIASFRGDSFASGTELARQILAIPGRHQTSVLLTCDRQRAGIIRRMHAWGPSFHLRKPVETTVLGPLVERLASFAQLPHPQHPTPPRHSSPARPSGRFPSVEIPRPTAAPTGDFFI